MAYSSTKKTFLSGALPVAARRRARVDADEVFPELEPAEPTRSEGAAPESLRNHAGRVARDVRTQLAAVLSDPAADNPVSRLMAYTLNLALMVIAFPVGFAMLIFNVLIGASLRVTAQVLVLTALAIALINAEITAQVLGLG